MIEISTEDADKVCALVRKIMKREAEAYEKGKEKLSCLEAACAKLKDTPFADAAEKMMNETVEHFASKHLENKAELEFVLFFMYTGSEKKA